MMFRMHMHEREIMSEKRFVDLRRRSDRRHHRRCPRQFITHLEHDFNALMIEQIYLLSLEASHIDLRISKLNHLKEYGVKLFKMKQQEHSSPSKLNEN